MPLRSGTPSTNIVDPSSNRNRTGTHLSTNIVLLVNNNAVAAVKQLSVTENRSLKMIDEIGTDGHIDSAPSASTNISGSCQRTRFDRQRIAEAFDRGFVHVSAQRIPFDIQIQDNFQGSDDSSVIVTTIRNVWIERIEVTYNADDFIIVETMGWQAESIDSVLGNGKNVVGSVHNGTGIPVIVNPYEAQADRGQYRGALDASGLINAFDGDSGRVL
jgi:hypothetical protein